MILLYDRLYYIIEFINNNDWINSVARIFKDIGNIAGWEKKYFGKFWRFFSDIEKVKRVWDLRKKISLNRLDAHPFQKLDRQYLS